MRTLLGAAGWLLTGLILLGDSSTRAESGSYQNNSQFGLNLPSASLPSGQDEVRTADGTSCRSSIGGDGPYMDIGVLGTPETSTVGGSAAAYGRLVIPFGAKPGRIDCTQLYNLEIARLRMELEIAKMGLSGKRTSAEADLSESWANEGWVNGRGDAPGSASALAKAEETAVDDLPPAIQQSEEALEDPGATNSISQISQASAKPKKPPVVTPAVDETPVDMDEPIETSLYGDDVVDSLY